MPPCPTPFPPVGGLLAVDPSVRSCGVAAYLDGVLVASDRLGAAPDFAPAARCSEVARDVVRWSTRVLQGTRVVHLVAEWPQVYSGAKSKGDPNDLLGLAGIASAVTALLGCVAPGFVLTPTPAEWIGQIPKSTTGDAFASARGALVVANLGPSELEACLRQHDAVDAAALGLWSLGRLALRTGRARPGAPGVARTRTARR